MPFYMYLIVSLVGGLILTVLLKLLFNKVTGKHASDWSNFSDFAGMFLGCSFIIFIIMLSATCESMGGCTG